MRLLVSGCTTSTKKLYAKRPDRLGVLYTPSNGNREWWGEEMVWACDNDCFNGLNAPAYLRMLAKVSRFATQPDWVSLPDVVGDHVETRRRFDAWRPLFGELNLPAAFVGQDGVQADEVPWDEIACFFVGGSTEWKLSDETGRLTREAHDRGKLVHYGRVNTLQRIVWIGRGIRDGRLWCDTIDGTGFSAFGDKRIPAGIRWIDSALADKQQVLWGGTA